MRRSPGTETEMSDERARVGRRQFPRGGAAIGLVAATAGMWECRTVESKRLTEQQEGNHSMQPKRYPLSSWGMLESWDVDLAAERFSSYACSS